MGHLEKGSTLNPFILLWPPVSGILIRSTADFVETIGAVAQLGERLYGIQEVVGSIPIGSTLSAPFPLKEAGHAFRKGHG